ncbi:MAG: phage tail assembly protein [Caulobacteraceae bacterium]
MDEPVIYTLKHPIEQTFTPKGGEARTETVTEVTVRRAKAKDLRLLDKFPGAITQSLALIGALTGLTPLQLDELDGEDVSGLGEIVGDFFPDTPTTGGPS